MSLFNLYIFTTLFLFGFGMGRCDGGEDGGDISVIIKFFLGLGFNVCRGDRGDVSVIIKFFLGLGFNVC